METLSFQAPLEMKQRLEAYAKQLDRSKAYLIRQALEEYMEDLEDYLAAKKAQASYDPRDNISLDEIIRLHKLDL